MNYNAKIYLTGYTELTSSDIADFLGKTFNDQEHSVATSLISAYEQYIAQACRRNFIYDLGNDELGNANRYVEVFDARLSEYLLYNYPANEIVRIELGDSMIYDKLDLPNSLYRLDREFSLRSGGVCFVMPQYSPSGTQRNAMRIFYTIEQFWGDDLVQAIKQWSAQTMNSREYGGKQVGSFSFSGLSVNFVPHEGGQPEYVEEIINIYKRILL